LCSFDTESLNKPYTNLNPSEEFENVFQESKHNKINTGIQQLYIIGLYDTLPVQEVLNIFVKYLPSHNFI
jgi:hypothetical protein